MNSKDKQPARQLLSGAYEDLVRLIQLEIQLFKLELGSLARASRRAVALFLVALTLVVPALTLLGFSAASALELGLGFEPWICYALVGLAAVSVAAACIIVALRTMENTTKEFLNGSGSALTRTRNTEHHTVLAPEN